MRIPSVLFSATFFFLVCSFAQVARADEEIPKAAQQLSITTQQTCSGDLAANEMRAAVLKYGKTAFSFDAFEAPGAYTWFSFEGKHGRGGIAYKLANFTRVIVGDPLLPKEDWTDALTAFLKTAGPLEATMATFASKDFVDIALQTNGAAIEAQTAVSLNPQEWQKSGKITGQIGQYVRKSAREGRTIVTMKNQKEPDAEFRVAAENLIADWLTNSLKRAGNVHDVNLWDASEHKQYFALKDPVTNEFQAIVVARPLPFSEGFYLWTARASNCPTGSLESTIAAAISSMRDDGVTYLTFGPFQAARPHVYVNNSGGTMLSRLILGKLVPAYIAYAGFDQTMHFFKKFNFQDSEDIYNLIWPKRAWLRPYTALDKLFHGKQKKK